MIAALPAAPTVPVGIPAAVGSSGKPTVAVVASVPFPMLILPLGQDRARVAPAVRGVALMLHGRDTLLASCALIVMNWLSELADAATEPRTRPLDADPSSEKNDALHILPVIGATTNPDPLGAPDVLLPDTRKPFTVDDALEMATAVAPPTTVIGAPPSLAVIARPPLGQVRARSAPFVMGTEFIVQVRCVLVWS
jgi:hypothetical protein